LKIIDHISEESIIIGAEYNTSKEKIIRILVNKLCDVNNIKDSQEVFNSVMDHEKKLSTGIGCGLAVPHTKTDFVDKMYISAMSLHGGIDFSSIDKEPVFLLFLLVSPKSIVGPHIKALSSICRLASDADVRKRLIDAKTPAEFYKLLDKAEKKYS